MNEAWTVVLVSGLGTIAMRGVGPVFLGGRRLPFRVDAVLRLLAPALLAALVAIGTFTQGRHLVLDARALGVAVAAVAVWFRVPALLVVVAAAATTAAARALGI